jgi:hypothetical protein
MERTDKGNMSESLLWSHLHKRCITLLTPLETQLSNTANSWLSDLKRAKGQSHNQKCHIILKTNEKRQGWLSIPFCYSTYDIIKLRRKYNTAVKSHKTKTTLSMMHTFKWQSLLSEEISNGYLLLSFFFLCSKATPVPGQ